MANVTITIPDALVPRLTAAARDTFPQYSLLTDVQLFRKITADHWSQVLSDYESRVASRTAFTQAAADGQTIN